MITQILLAAGLSVRMKTSKPLLDFAGIPLLSRLLQECRQSLADSVIVVLGHEKERILEQVDFSGAQVVENPNYKSGQTSSFTRAMKAGKRRDCLILSRPIGWSDCWITMLSGWKRRRKRKTDAPSRL